MKLSEIIRDKHEVDYSQEIADLLFYKDYYLKRLEANKLLKEDRGKLMDLIEIIELGEC